MSKCDAIAGIRLYDCLAICHAQDCRENCYVENQNDRSNCPCRIGCIECPCDDFDCHTMIDPDTV